MQKVRIISHIKQSDMAVQSNDTHQYGVAKLASKFAGEFGMSEWGRALWLLVNHCKKLLTERFHPDGFNVGINVGEAAGQSVFHVHIHLIPRYKGDVENPKGGVRGVIPNKQKY